MIDQRASLALGVIVLSLMISELQQLGDDLHLHHERSAPVPRENVLNVSTITAATPTTFTTIFR